MHVEDLDIYGIYHEIQSLDLELAQLRNLNFYKTTVLTDQPRGSKKKDKLIDYVAGVCKVESMLTYDMNVLIQKRQKAVDYINNIQSGTIRAIFRYKCVNGKNWSWIAREMGKDRRVVKDMYYTQLANDNVLKK